MPARRPRCRTGAPSRARYRAELITDDAGKLAAHLERASGERLSALDAAAHAATVTGIVREVQDPAHGGAPDQAIERYWSGAGEQVLGIGAELVKQPDRQIAEWARSLRPWSRRCPERATGRPTGRRRRKATGNLRRARRIWTRHMSPLRARRTSGLRCRCSRRGDARKGRHSSSLPNTIHNRTRSRFSRSTNRRCVVLSVLGQCLDPFRALCAPHSRQ